MLQFDFMRRALVAGFLLSIMIPLIGVVLVNRKTSMLGDALSHTSLAGVGMGLILGFDPVMGAIIICIVSAFAIEAIRKKFPQYGDMATAVIMSTGLGLAAILSDFAPGGNNFESYLFGSISSVTNQDLINVSIVALLVFFISLVYYGALLDISIDVNLARIAGVKVKRINSMITFLAAITVAMACKIVGALLVASLIVLPVATSLIIARSYKQTMLLSIILGVLYTMMGIVISYHFDLKPGGAIVINSVVGMIIVVVYKKIRYSYLDKFLI
ncbi:metal ABC transporter permease [Peptostreptococcus equinus]|uniref:Metal ABC transporter permease n=1 Tax=Peptostreptococcus equinus TaxID=3003601 RepID=A0ABY7JQA9_9FIRM|nr:metal ABC transporter permease [Peptostreptococcus sp. CBA3647]WAW15538.1 metal ABC transporter permease [Peptostreptococcus sp. CBA3647]